MLVILLSLGVNLAAHAAQGDREICEKQDDKTIPACTRLLSSEKLADAERAILYVQRGGAYRQKKDYARALADLTSAVQLLQKRGSPEATSAVYVVRAGIYVEKAEYDNAIADYNAALKLNPNSEQASEGIKRTEAMMAPPKPPGEPIRGHSQELGIGSSANSRRVTYTIAATRVAV